MDIIATHHFVSETAVSVVDKAMRMVGGVGLFKSSPLEQMYRDVRAAIIHQPFQGYDALAWLGKLAFGIPHDTLPRWGVTGPNVQVPGGWLHSVGSLE